MSVCSGKDTKRMLSIVGEWTLVGNLCEQCSRHIKIKFPHCYKWLACSNYPRAAN